MGPREKVNDAGPALATFRIWGLKTLGELAALPPADLVARLGRPALAWQAAARGEDLAPLVPTRDEERFDGTMELEWPIEGLEPLSFVLTRLLEPLSTRLERRDRGAAALHVALDLVNEETHARRLELPSPIRDVRTLRTLALLDLETHPPAAAIDRVTVTIEPTPGRIVQHALFTRPQPTPDQLATLLARLAAVMGQDRIGAPAEADSHEPGAFAITPYRGGAVQARGGGAPRELNDADVGVEAAATLALRRYRRPLPARVAVADGVPVRLTIDRRGAGGGAIVRAAGPWRSSGNWWAAGETCPPPWSRDEWDVALGDGTVYRIFQDRQSEAWFVDAIVD